MQTSLEKSQMPPQRVKNIVFRYSDPNEALWIINSQQEISYILKYGLKYYKSLNLQVTSQRPLLSKLKKMKKLKSLKIMVSDEDYLEFSWLLGKLNGVGGLLRRLETLGLDFSMNSRNIRELFQNKKLLSNLTDLVLVADFDPIFAKIPRICKKLSSFAFNFERGFDDERPGFKNLLTCLQKLKKLKSLRFNWPREVRILWRHFKPQSSLEHLALRIGAHSLINARLFEEDKDIVEHWEKLRKLKILDFSLAWSNPEEFDLMRTYVTSVLNKTEKLETVTFLVGGPVPEEGSQRTYEPFLAKDVTHLSESLEKFEYRFDASRGNQFGMFDLKALEPFKNLKSLKLGGNIVPYGNLEEVVSLLEESQKKEGEYAILELNLKRSIDSPIEWLRETLKVLERPEKSLKVILDLEFALEGYMETLEGFCYEIHSVKTIEGLRITLTFNEDYDCAEFPVERIKEILNKYPGIKNVEVHLSNYNDWWTFIKNDQEKEFHIVM